MRFVTRLLALVLSLSLVTANAQVVRYEKEKIRDRLLEVGANPPEEKLIVEGEFTSDAARGFVDFYRDTIRPQFDKITSIIMRYMTLKLLLDTGTYRDDSEYKKFQGDFLGVSGEYTSFLVDKGYTADLNAWAQRAEGLDGDLPRLAKRMAKERELQSFPESLKPKLDQLDALETEYELALKDAPANKGLEEYRTTRSEVRRKYKDGELSFEEAQTQSNALVRRLGPHFIGYEAVQAKGANLNQIAVLRTELAHAKGFKSWAGYALETNGQGYEERYRGAENQRAFLRDYISALGKLANTLTERRIAELKLEDRRASLRAQHLGLLTLPDLNQVRQHFPSDKLTDIWEQTMLESGFSKATLSQIVVDDQFRHGKNRNMAYLSPVLGPYTGFEKIDAATLNLIPTDNHSHEWKPGFVYILQSYPGGGVSELRTAFHEGGHALEKLLKFKQLSADESYGYVEVPSMTMEYFTEDPVVLAAKAVPVNGVKPSLQEIERLVANAEKNEIYGLLDMTTQALFDIELWDYDYTAPGAQTYLQRVESLARELNQLAGWLDDVDTPVPFFYHWVSTTHFTSGSVRNIGYSYAEIGSRMMRAYISDELERRSGRRDWLRQPELADIFANKFFAEGWKSPFPGNVEKITGRKFDPKAVVEDMARKLAGDDLGKN